MVCLKDIRLYVREFYLFKILFLFLGLLVFLGGGVYDVFRNTFTVSSMVFDHQPSISLKLF